MIDLAFTEAVYGLDSPNVRPSRSIKQMMQGLPQGGKIALGVGAGAVLAGGMMMDNVATEPRERRSYSVHCRQSTARMLEQRERALKELAYAGVEARDVNRAFLVPPPPVERRAY